MKNIIKKALCATLLATAAIVPVQNKAEITDVATSVAKSIATTNVAMNIANNSYNLLSAKSVMNAFCVGNTVYQIYKNLDEEYKKKITQKINDLGYCSMLSFKGMGALIIEPIYLAYNSMKSIFPDMMELVKSGLSSTWALAKILSPIGLNLYLQKHNYI